MSYVPVEKDPQATGHNPQAGPIAAPSSHSALQRKLRSMSYTEGQALLSPRSSGQPVQCKGQTNSAEAVQAAAAQGVQGGGSTLPYLDKIQASFGSHDVSSVQAYQGGAASGACAAIGAEAYATGNSVAFGGSPTLHTAAHEAAHIVQQRAGVSLKGGVGQAGDTYEQHADAVADLVVQGKSAEGLLSQMAHTSTESAGPVIQRAVQMEGGGATPEEAVPEHPAPPLSDPLLSELMIAIERLENGDTSAVTDIEQAVQTLQSAMGAGELPWVVEDAAHALNAVINVTENTAVLDQLHSANRLLGAADSAETLSRLGQIGRNARGVLTILDVSANVLVIIANEGNFDDLDVQMAAVGLGVTAIGQIPVIGPVFAAAWAIGSLLDSVFGISEAFADAYSNVDDGRLNISPAHMDQLSAVANIDDPLMLSCRGVGPLVRQARRLRDDIDLYASYENTQLNMPEEEYLERTEDWPGFPDNYNEYRRERGQDHAFDTAYRECTDRNSSPENRRRCHTQAMEEAPDPAGLHDRIDERMEAFNDSLNDVIPVFRSLQATSTSLMTLSNLYATGLRSSVSACSMRSYDASSIQMEWRQVENALSEVRNRSLTQSVQTTRDTWDAHANAVRRTVTSSCGGGGGGSGRPATMMH